ncbi:MAG: MBL fold metallo-hydrolase [Candidatus Pacearchaeota archaeon]|nr:MBL fold metallo-hydrolase [Candidatus Pacearchaeota archaeon]
MKFSALSSGSSGNCFYIKHNDSAILVDAGISCRQVVDKLSSLGEDASKIKGIFITHEHADHVKGVDVLARQFDIPIYATKGTIDSCFLCSRNELINRIKKNETVKIAGLEVEAFSKSHDGLEPVSFKINNDKTLSIITDVGKICGNVIDAVSDSDFLVIESNHDSKMLAEGQYPYFLKNRIASELGHLSNLKSALCVLEHGRNKLKNLMLAHLSQNNNTPQLALKTFSLLKERKDLHPRIMLSLRDRATSLMKI